MILTSKYDLSMYSPVTNIKNFLYSLHINPLISKAQALILIDVKNTNIILENSGPQTLPQKAKHDLMWKKD